MIKSDTSICLKIGITPTTVAGNLICIFSTKYVKWSIMHVKKET